MFCFLAMGGWYKMLQVCACTDILADVSPPLIVALHVLGGDNVSLYVNCEWGPGLMAYGNRTPLTCRDVVLCWSYIREPSAVLNCQGEVRGHWEKTKRHCHP